MKDLKNSMFKSYELNKVENLSKIIGGATQGTKYDNGHQCGSDTIDYDTHEGIAVIIDGVKKVCDFVDLSTPEIISKPPQQ